MMHSFRSARIFTVSNKAIIITSCFGVEPHQFDIACEIIRSHDNTKSEAWESNRRGCEHSANSCSVYFYLFKIDIVDELRSTAMNQNKSDSKIREN